MQNAYRTLLLYLLSEAMYTLSPLQTSDTALWGSRDDSNVAFFVLVEGHAIASNYGLGLSRL